RATRLGCCRASTGCNTSGKAPLGTAVGRKTTRATSRFCLVSRARKTTPERFSPRSFLTWNWASDRPISPFFRSRLSMPARSRPRQGEDALLLAQPAQLPDDDRPFAAVLGRLHYRHPGSPFGFKAT